MVKKVTDGKKTEAPYFFRETHSKKVKVFIQIRTLSIITVADSEITFDTKIVTDGSHGREKNMSAILL